MQDNKQKQESNMATSVEIPLRDTDEVSDYFLLFYNLYNNHSQDIFILSHGSGVSCPK